MTALAPNRQTQRIFKRLQPDFKKVLEPAIAAGVTLKQATGHVAVMWEGKQITVLSHGKHKDPVLLVSILKQVGALPADFRSATPAKLVRARAKRNDKAARLLHVKVRLQEELKARDALGGLTRDPRARRRTEWITEKAPEAGERIDLLRSQVAYLLRTPPDDLTLSDRVLGTFERILGISEAETDVLPAASNGNGPAERDAIAVADELEEPPTNLALINLLNEKEKTIKLLLTQLDEASGNAPDDVALVLTLIALADPAQAELAVKQGVDILERMRK